MTPTDGTAARDFDVVLVLSGGNALGAFQAGVYQALHEHNLLPDWIVGASIGAINGALIAGTLPERRLEALPSFWRPGSLGITDLGLLIEEGGGGPDGLLETGPASTPIHSQ